MKTLIVTHPGRAHFDEFLAVTLILTMHPDEEFAIERRLPASAELDDPGVWVVDVGERHEPQRRNFDHHQDLDLNASFMLVAKHLGLAERLSISPWWHYKDRIDRLGPFKVAKEMGIKELTSSYSPVESWILDLFAKNPTEMHPLMRSFGQTLLDAADRLHAQLDFWKRCETVVCKDKVVLIGHTDDATGVQEFSHGMQRPAAICLSYDGRGVGWRLARINHTQGVDFSRLEGHAEIKFAHKSGFIAKTKTRLPVDKVLDMVALAIE